MGLAERSLIVARGRAVVARCGCYLLGGLLLLVPLLGVQAGDYKEEDGVLLLNEQNFDEAIKEYPMILVEFYAPWCGHCKQLAPEYSKAAKLLKVADPPVPLGKVDATMETKLAEKYGVRGYPTMKFFIDGKDQEYTGGRTDQSIMTWVLKKAGPAAAQLKDLQTTEKFLKENKLAVIGLFTESTPRDAFESVARQSEDVMFAYSTNAEVAAKYQVTPPSVVMHFPHDEQQATFGGDVSKAEELESFVKAHRLPVLITFDGDVAPELFSDGREVIFLFRDSDEKGQKAEAALKDVAHEIKGKYLISLAGSSEPMDTRLMDYLGVEFEELPTMRLIKNPMGGMEKYRLEGEITADSIKKLTEDYSAGKLKPHIKSEPKPESQPGPVHVLVGSSFQEVVMDPTKDVMVEFYAPWCGHCKKLEPLYKELAKKFHGVDSVIIAKMDATANDVVGLDIQGFPTIKFWPANQKDDPIDYDGDRDVESFTSFIEEKASVNFNKDEL